MARLIDADALDAKLEDIYPPPVSMREINIRALVHASLLSENIAPTIDAEPVQQWISVKDRMPESGVHVLVCCEIHPHYSGVMPKRYICDGYYAAEHSLSNVWNSDYSDACDYDEKEDNYYLKEGWYEVIKNWTEFSSVVIEDFVTHWMPLPEPPKEENDNEDAQS